MEGGVEIYKTSSSVLDVQFPLLIVQLNVYTPSINPEISVVGEFGSAIVHPGGPETSAHSPVPTKGKFPDNIALLPHIVWSGPPLLKRILF